MVNIKYYSLFLSKRESIDEADDNTDENYVRQRHVPELTRSQQPLNQDNDPPSSVRVLLVICFIVVNLSLALAIFFRYWS